MEKRFCDLCGKEILNKWTTIKIKCEWQQRKNSTHSTRVDYLGLDFCEDCKEGRFNFFCNVKNGKISYDNTMNHARISMLHKPINDLSLSVRTKNCLKNARLSTLADVIKTTESQLRKTRNFGLKSLFELKAFLRENGLNLRPENY